MKVIIVKEVMTCGDVLIKGFWEFRSNFYEDSPNNADFSHDFEVSDVITFLDT